jgi:opacity protein-like surface antigen/outer membrane protease
MRRWVIVLAAIGLAQGAAARERHADVLRGSAGSNYLVIQTPAQEVEHSGASSYASAYHPPITGLKPAVWNGFYFGPNVGGGWGTANFSDPFGPSIFGDRVSTPNFMAGGQVGYNWQSPNSNWVFGLETDLDWLDSDGTNTCLAASGLFVSANCRVRPSMMGDVTARAGWAYGRSNHSLVYGKIGPAFIRNKVDITTNATADFIGLPPQSTSSTYTKTGWTIGAGVEHAIAPAWSVKLEYDYANFGGKDLATPLGIVQVVPGNPGTYFLTAADTTRMSQNVQQVKLGLNYKIGMDPTARWGSAASAFPVKAPIMIAAPGWEFEAGARYWYSRGKFQKDLGSTTDPALADMLNSRLTYNSTANAGEFFGRVEAPVNIFVKGNIGLGSLAGGQLYDEDWVIFGGTVPYSNTLSDPVKGKINYATLDLGYDFFRGPGYKLGGFAGYNYYRENKSAYGCNQIANPLSDCVPAISSSVLVITEDDTWKSLRVGVNGQVMIGDQLKLEADAAYLPYVKFSGTDDHVLRDLVSPESATGRGVQLEGILSYLVTDRFSLGVGGRYWAMWTTKDAITEFGDAPCPCQTQPAKTDRYGVFLQAAYQLNGLPGFR